MNLKMKVVKNVGKRAYEFEVEGSNLFNIITESQKLSFYDIDKCDLCSSDDLILNAHIAQDKYKYVKVKCLNCKATLNFGQQQEDPDIFYLRKDKTTKKYDWKVAEKPTGEAD